MNIKSISLTPDTAGRRKKNVGSTCVTIVRATQPLYSIEKGVQSTKNSCWWSSLRRSLLRHRNILRNMPTRRYYTVRWTGLTDRCGFRKVLPVVNRWILTVSARHLYETFGIPRNRLKPSETVANAGLARWWWQIYIYLLNWKLPQTAVNTRVAQVPAFNLLRLESQIRFLVWDANVA